MKRLIRKYFKLEQTQKNISLIILCVYFLGIFYGLIQGRNSKILQNKVSKSLSPSKIFDNNLSVFLNILILGGFTGGIYSLVVIFINGMIVGQAFAFLHIKNRLYQIFTAFLPHTFFEISGFSAFCFCSFLPICLLLQFLKNNEKISFKIIFKSLSLLFFGVTMLLLAALIEGGVSRIL
ncbi:MAG: stage II sporulation protein M [Oscillospiraceae bacterium]|jgi:uncharacterized membrane protein SpoIIM required for sporulation|nr:stage II sporulation protein M [Oscillospiraceae bacterium]